MDVAKTLVRCVARAFYETKHILVIDAIMIHSALRDDDLAHLLGTQTKELHKLCGKLKEDRMVHVHSRPEAKEGQNRPVNRTYYYVDFRATIDAIKYRMHRLVKAVESKMNNDVDSKGYACPRCHKRFSTLDAMTYVNMETSMFDCDVCGTQLVDDDDSDEIKQSQERLGRLMEQIDKIISMLRKIDELVVPANEFNDALAVAVPVIRERSSAQAMAPGVLPSGKSSNANGPQFEISITSSADKSVAELNAERDKKNAQAEQNALPVWHTQSTVSGDLTTLGRKEAAVKAANGSHEVMVKSEEEKKKETDEKDGIQQTAIQQYYAAMAAKAAKEKEEEYEEEDEEGDEEEEEEEEDAEFEDLPVNATQNTSTAPSASSTSKAASPSSAPPTSAPSPMTGSLKPPLVKIAADDDPESDSSARSSLAVAKKRPDVGEAASPAKRVKIQMPEPDEAEDSDEEEEFVDV